MRRIVGLVIGAYLIWLGIPVLSSFKQASRATDVALVLEGDPNRISAAAEFAKLNPDIPVYISSEKNFYSINIDRIHEAGLTISRFELRRCAADTVTNFTCVVDELHEAGYRHILLITSDTHMRRALIIGRIVLGSRGMTVSPMSVVSRGRPREAYYKVFRDMVRSLFWVVTGITGVG